MFSKYLVNNSSLICNHGTWHRKRDVISAKYYGKGSDAMFEGIKVRVPENCDGYLTSLYDDWRTPPPPEKQKGHYLYKVCDTEKSYTYCLNNK